MSHKMSHFFFLFRHQHMSDLRRLCVLLGGWQRLARPYLRPGCLQMLFWGPFMDHWCALASSIPPQHNTIVIGRCLTHLLSNSFRVQYKVTFKTTFTLNYLVRQVLFKWLNHSTGLSDPLKHVRVTNVQENNLSQVKKTPQHTLQITNKGPSSRKWKE